MTTALVVDSGCQAPPDLVERLALRVVPVTVVVDGVRHAEGVDLDATGITEALRRGAALTTSSPSPCELLEAYAAAARAGATQVLSVHTGGTMSGTVQSARLAAGMASVPVEVVDTGTASFTVTMAAWAAADALADGGSPQQAAAAARRTAAEVGNVFIVGALALARRGGRLAAGVPDTQVNVLALAEGVMRPVGAVGDAEEAVAAMASYVVQQGGGRPLRVGVGHLGAGDLAAGLESSLRERVVVQELVRYVVGPSIAVHTGLGTVGCVFAGV